MSFQILAHPLCILLLANESQVNIKASKNGLILTLIGGEPWTLFGNGMLRGIKYLSCLAIDHLLILIHFHVKGEHKSCTCFLCRDEVKLSSKVHHDLLGNEQTQAYLFSICQSEVLFVIHFRHGAKKLENCFLVFLLDTNSLILDNENNLALRLIKTNIDNDVSLVRILNSILYDIECYLLESLGVTNKVSRQLLVLFHFGNVVKERVLIHCLVRS